MNPSTAAAAAIVDALVGRGIREVVLCPGSRSAPLAYAVLSAERAGRLRLHVRVDERSAGFLALGLAKRTGRPAVVVTTSGTAVANLHPAVLEAHHAHVPLIVLSADRPAELRGTGANQTTTQPGIFAGALRAEVDLEPLPWPGDDASVSGLSGWTDQLRTAVAVLVDDAVGVGAADFPGAAAGPVHLNVQLREPLVPDLEPLVPDLEPLVPDPEPAPVPAPAQGGSDAAALTPSTPGFGLGVAGRGLPVLPERTLVVLGDLPRVGQAQVALAWAERQGIPVVAEPFGPYPRRGVVQHGVLVLCDRDFVDTHAPECVVVIGRPTLSRPVSALVRRSGVRLVVVESGPTWTAGDRESEPAPWSMLGAPDRPGGPHPSAPTPTPTPTPEPVATAVEAGQDDWAASWHARGARIEASLVVAPPSWPSGAAVVRTLGTALPSDAVLFVGSSNAPRDLDTALGRRTGRLDVVASRGLAGIDGCVSTAIGLALAEPERPAYALMGDLTFLHDANGLLIGPAEPRPDLTIVVVNDDGGGIFHLLEPGEPERAVEFERLFGTPTGTDLEALCRAHGIRHTRVDTAAALARNVAAQPNGISVVEIPASRAGRRDEAADLRSR